MYYYSIHVRPMIEKDKQTYNFLIVGLSLALNMSLASSLKQMAVDVRRWWVLSLTKRSRLREVDFTLHLGPPLRSHQTGLRCPKTETDLFLVDFTRHYKPSISEKGLSSYA